MEEGSFPINVAFDGKHVCVECCGLTEEADAEYYKDLPGEFGYKLVDDLVAAGLLEKRERGEFKPPSPHTLFFRLLCKIVREKMPVPPIGKTNMKIIRRAIRKGGIEAVAWPTSPQYQQLKKYLIEKREEREAERVRQ